MTEEACTCKTERWKTQMDDYHRGDRDWFEWTIESTRSGKVADPFGNEWTYEEAEAFGAYFWPRPPEETQNT